MGSANDASPLGFRFDSGGAGSVPTGGPVTVTGGCRHGGKVRGASLLRPRGRVEGTGVCISQPLPQGSSSRSGVRLRLRALGIRPPVSRDKVPSPRCPSAAPTNSAIQIRPLTCLSCTSPGSPRVWARGQRGEDATRDHRNPCSPGCWNLSSGPMGLCHRPGAIRATLVSQGAPRCPLSPHPGQASFLRDSHGQGGLLSFLFY